MGQTHHLLGTEQTREMKRRRKKELRSYKEAIELPNYLLDDIQEFRDEMRRGESLDSLDQDFVSVDFPMKRFATTFNSYRDACSRLPNQDFVPELPKSDFDLALKILSVGAVYQALEMVETATEEAGEEKCVICIEELMVVGSCSVDNVSALHCGHKFHEICIVKWLFKNNFCPLCRCKIIEGASYREISN